MTGFADCEFKYYKIDVKNYDVLNREFVNDENINNDECL